MNCGNYRRNKFWWKNYQRNSVLMKIILLENERIFWSKKKTPNRIGDNEQLRLSLKQSTDRRAFHPEASVPNCSDGRWIDQTNFSGLVKDWVLAGTKAAGQESGGKTAKLAQYYSLFCILLSSSNYRNNLIYCITVNLFVDCLSSLPFLIDVS